MCLCKRVRVRVYACYRWMYLLACVYIGAVYIGVRVCVARQVGNYRAGEEVNAAL